MRVQTKRKRERKIERKIEGEKERGREKRKKELCTKENWLRKYFSIFSLENSFKSKRDFVAMESFAD